MRRSCWVGWGVALAVACLASAAQARSTTAGRLYTETNAKANQVIVFDRRSDGTLRREQTVSTGGAGAAGRTGCKAVDACQFVDSQGQVNLVASQHLLFVVNTGSDTISSFRITSSGLKLADRKSTHGRFPNSLASHGTLLYVVNTGTLNVTGFRFSASGKLTPIRGSTRKLDRLANAGAARQIGFDTTGRFLDVTLLSPAEVESFAVKRNGALGSLHAFPTTNPLPFGFVFDHSNELVVTELHDLNGAHGIVSTYRGSKSGAALLDSKPTGGLGPCWIVLDRSGGYVYVVNTGAGNAKGATIAVFSLSSGGALAPLQLTAPEEFAPGEAEFERTDELLSADGKYLYVIAHGKPPTTSRIDIYGVAGSGKLTLLGQTPRTLPTGIGGLAGG